MNDWDVTPSRFTIFGMWISMTGFLICQYWIKHVKITRRILIFFFPHPFVKGPNMHVFEKYACSDQNNYVPIGTLNVPIRTIVFLSELYIFRSERYNDHWEHYLFRSELLETEGGHLNICFILGYRRGALEHFLHIFFAYFLFLVTFFSKPYPPHHRVPRSEEDGGDLLMISGYNSDHLSLNDHFRGVMIALDKLGIL